MKDIFKWFTQANDKISLVRIAWFVERFGYSEFTGVDRVLYLFLQYCADLDIPAAKHYLSAFLKTEGKKLIKRNNIKLETMANYNYEEPASLEEAYRVISTATQALYDEYFKQEIGDHSFKVDMAAFMVQRKSERIQELLISVFPRLSNGDDIDEVLEAVATTINTIQTTYDIAHLEKLDFLSGDREVTKGVDIQKLLFKTTLPCIDGDLGGMFTKMVLSFTGSPGSGKTRAAMALFAYIGITMAKIDVLFDELELSKMEVQNMFIAHHIVHLYGGKVKIPDSKMNRGELSPEEQRYYESAKMDLFESGKYGKLHIRTDGLVVEKLEKDMYMFLKHNRNVKLWVVDYAGLIQSKPVEKFGRRYDKYEIIDEAYKIAKRIANIADIGVLFLNQFNKEGIDAAEKGKRIVSGMVEGGQSIARNADYDMAMCMTPEQELANMRTLSTVKKRAAKGFQNVPIHTDLSVSIFRQLKQQATN